MSAANQSLRPILLQPPVVEKRLIILATDWFVVCSYKVLIQIGQCEVVLTPEVQPNVLIYPSRTFEHRPKWVVLVLMQDPLLKQKQNPFVAAAVGCICLSLHYPTRSSHWSARRPSIIATFSCVKNRAVFHGDSIVFLKRWWGLNSGVLYPGKPPVPSLPSVFYFYYHSPFFSPTMAATCTSGCLHTHKKKKKSGESIWDVSFLAVEFAWTNWRHSPFPESILLSGHVEQGNTLIDNVCRDAVATTLAC